VSTHSRAPCITRRRYHPPLPRALAPQHDNKWGNRHNGYDRYDGYSSKGGDHYDGYSNRYSGKYDGHDGKYDGGKYDGKVCGGRARARVPVGGLLSCSLARLLDARTPHPLRAHLALVRRARACSTSRTAAATTTAGATKRVAALRAACERRVLRERARAPGGWPPRQPAASAAGARAPAA